MTRIRLLAGHQLALLAVLLLATPAAQSQQKADEPLNIESTVQGSEEQPKTIYVLPWQQPVGQIRIPPSSLPLAKRSVSPLDRQQFLRFIAVQHATVATRSTQPDPQQ